MSQGRDQQVQFSVHTIGTEHSYKGDGPCYFPPPPLSPKRFLPIMSSKRYGDFML